LTPHLWLKSSKSAPRNSSRITLSLRWAYQRPLPVRTNSASRVSRSPVLGAAPKLSVLVLDIQILYLANHCPTKSWGGGLDHPFEPPPECSLAEQLLLELG
jgi:hypothetical protein